MKMEIKKITTRTQTQWLEDGIVYSQSNPGAEHTLADAIENIQAGSLLSEGKKRPTLIDLRNVKSINKEARTYYSGEEAAKIDLAVAILIDNAISKIIGNFFLGLNKTLFPTRLFTKEKEAIEWLKTFIE
jgi:hypothetical protein